MHAGGSESIDGADSRPAKMPCRTYARAPGCWGHVLLSNPLLVKMTDAEGCEMTMHIHEEILFKVPYFVAAAEFAAEANVSPLGCAQMRVVLPAGCSCECVPKLFWRLYVGERGPNGGTSLPVHDLEEAVELGKVADLLQFPDVIFEELLATAYRLAVASESLHGVLSDPVLPAFLHPLRRQILETDPLPIETLSPMLTSAADGSSTSRDQAEETLRFQACKGSAIASALTKSVSWWGNGRLIESDRYSSLQWLLGLVGRHSTDPSLFSAFFEHLCTAQRKLESSPRECDGFKRKFNEAIFDSSISCLMREAFVSHLDRCGAVGGKCWLDAAKLPFVRRYTERYCSFQVDYVEEYPNVLCIDSLPVSRLVQSAASAMSLMDLERRAVLTFLSSHPALLSESLHQPGFRSSLEVNELMVLCRQVVKSPEELKRWATVGVIEPLPLHVRNFLCRELLCHLGTLPEDVALMVHREVSQEHRKMDKAALIDTVFEHEDAQDM